MMTTLLLGLALSSPPGVEVAPAPRPAMSDVVTRYLERLRVRSNHGVSSAAEFEEIRLWHLLMIAMHRRFCLENIALFEWGEAWTNNPERKERYRKVAEDLRRELLKLDERERRCREDGPPLPEIVLPPRR